MILMMWVLCTVVVWHCCGHTLLCGASPVLQQHTAAEQELRACITCAQAS